MITALAKDRYKFFGLYRGRVENNADPLGRGRVQVRVYPMMEGIKTTDLPWAEPCWAGILKIPAIGNWVWVMFQEGEITSPVWLGWSVPFSEEGLRYRGGERRKEFDKKEFIGKEIYVEYGAEYPNAVMIRHRSGSRLIFYDNGRIHIESAGGARVVLYENGKVLIEGVRIDLNP